MNMSIPWMTNRPALALVAGLTLTVFLADLAAPTGLGLWLCYALPMFILVRANGTGKLMPFLALISVLAFLDHYLSAPGVPPLYSIFNRTAGLAALWLLGWQLIQMEGMETRLRKKRLLLEAVVDTVPSMVVMTGPDGRIEIFNRACEELTGYSRAEVVGRTIPELFLPAEWVPVVLERFANPYATELKLPYENPWRTKSGEERMIEWRCAALPISPQGHPSVLGAGVDVTERRRLEDALQASHKALETKVAERTASLEAANALLNLEIEERKRVEHAVRENEARFRALIENSSDIISLLDGDGSIRFLSPSMARLLGYAPEELLGTSGFDLVHPDELQETLAGLGDAIRNPGAVIVVEHRLRHKGGQWICFESHGRSFLEDPAVRGIVVNSRDISERKRAEEALRASESLLKTAFDNIPVEFWVRDREQLCTMQSALVVQNWGDQLGKTVGEAGVDEQSLAIWRENNRRALQGEIVRGEVAYGHGLDRRWCFNVLAPVRTGGEITGMLGINIDITELKRAEMALRVSESRFRTLFEAAPTGISIIGEDYRFIEINKALAKMLGYGQEGIVGLSAAQVTHSEDVEKSREMAGKLFTGEHDSFELEKRYVRKNGEVFWGRLRGSLLRSEQGGTPTAIGIITDITDQKEAERRRIENLERQRDTLVREVHHRIKNNLQGVIGLLRQSTHGRPELKELIETAVARIGAIALVHGLHGSSRSDALQIRDILTGIVMDKKRTFPEVSIEVAMETTEASWSIQEREAVPLALAINELVINAIKACLREGGDKPPVYLSLEEREFDAVVEVRNACGNLPEGFDFETGKELGTGLQLIKALLPSDGARLVFSGGEPAGVSAELSIAPPVLTKPA